MDEMDKTRMCIGIDLGTTNTSVAISRTDTNGIVIVEDHNVYQVGSNRKQETLPSVLYVQDGREIVGNKALDLMKNYVQAADEEPHYIANSKRYIGTNRKWTIDGKDYSAIDVAEKILRQVIKDPKIKGIIDHSYVCITVPAQFGPDQVNNTKEAAIRAGFKDVELFPEPQAAILSFLDNEKDKREDKKLDVAEKKKRILVIDIGGGTCDVCIEDVWEKSKGKYTFKNLAINRDNLGGVDFDQRIASYLASKYDIDDPTDIEYAQLIDIGQTFKETISRVIDDYIYEYFDGDEDEFIKSGRWESELGKAECVSITREIADEDITFEMSAKEMLEAISPLIYDAGDMVRNKDEQELSKNMEKLIDDTLEEYGIDIDEIDAMFITGGMSKCFILKAALYDMYCKEIVTPDDPLLAVSRGASLLNKYDREEIESNNKMPRSILIETSDGHLKTLIAAGDSVPVTKSVEETFKTASRKAIIIRLFEGKDEFDCGLRKLNNVYTIRLEKGSAVGREFAIKYSINRSKQIKFAIEFLDDGKTYNIEAKVKDDEEEEE